MGGWQPKPDYLARVMKRGGRPHALEAIDPARTALIVVDMQRYFVAEGMPAGSPQVRALVPVIAGFARALRDAGGTIAWVLTDGSPDFSGDWSSYKALFSPESWARRETLLAPDGEGYPLADGLDALPGDVVSVKRRHSSFAEGSSDLDAQLRARGIDTVLVSGTATGVCCGGTARDAMARGYHAVMLADALAAQTQEEHDAALSLHYLYFGDVRTTGEIAGMLTR